MVVLNDLRPHSMLIISIFKACQNTPMVHQYCTVVQHNLRVDAIICARSNNLITLY